jgi:hypothetical protein
VNRSDLGLALARATRGLPLGSFRGDEPDRLRRVGNEGSQRSDDELLQGPAVRAKRGFGGFFRGRVGTGADDRLVVRTHADEYRIAAVTFSRGVSC